VRKLESLDVRRGTIDLRRTTAPADAPAAPASRAAPQADVLPPMPDDAGDLLTLHEADRHEPSLGNVLRAPVEPAVPAAAPAAPTLAPLQPEPLPLDLGERPAPLEVDLARLAMIGVLTPDMTDSQLANQLRLIKRPLIRAAQGKSATPVANANRVMVSSALPGEGKSFIALNIAMSIAMERDSRVLLIDADTTRPSLSAVLGAPLSQGLLDLLTNPMLSPAQTLLKTNIERLAFLPSGTPRQNATELLASTAMEQLVAHLATRYTDRILIFDAPPLLAAPEPPVLASYMGQIVVVVEAQRTTHKAAQQALAAVENCPVVMTVLNKCRGSAAPHGYYARSTT
jgi:receptor protein-tyrosine kinase